MIQELCALTKQRMMSEVEERMRRLQEEAIITKLSAGTIIDAVHSQRSKEGDGERERENFGDMSVYWRRGVGICFFFLE